MSEITFHINVVGMGWGLTQTDSRGKALLGCHSALPLESGLLRKGNKRVDYAIKLI